jgi:uncharacterized protein YecT (DUF1311 family)
MKPVIFSVMFAVFVLQTARAHSCDDAQSEADMRVCADKAYEASNAELNALYRKIQKRLADDKDTGQLLVKAQRAWLSFRDAECAFSTSRVEGGSIYPTISLMCLDDLTRKRVDDLKTYLDCDEGDMSCPVPTADAGAVGRPG